MHRLFKTLFLLPWLSACAPSWAPDGGVPAWGGASAGPVHDFNWRLSGDRQVAPLQVFDDGRHTWLQFAPGQAVPALFIEQDGVERPVPYLRQAPYAILQGKWPAIVMRGGALRARADYLGAGAYVASASGAGAVGASMASGAAVQGRGDAPGFSGAVSLPGASASAGSPGALGSSGLPGALGSTGLTGGSGSSRSPGASASAAARLYRVGPADENMRRALSRWAGLAGWTFQPEHWAVDVDIPLAGSADFSDDFKRSVRALVAATELGERPLQPCFYANQVLRVIPLSQACDRTAVRPGASI